MLRIHCGKWIQRKTRGFQSCLIHKKIWVPIQVENMNSNRSKSGVQLWHKGDFGRFSCKLSLNCYAWHASRSHILRSSNPFLLNSTHHISVPVIDGIYSHMCIVYTAKFLCQKVMCSKVVKSVTKFELSPLWHLMTKHTQQHKDLLSLHERITFQHENNHCNMIYSM